MRWGFALVLGLMVAVPATADASRQDQGARQQASRSAPQARPAVTPARQTAIPARQSAAAPRQTTIPSRQAVAPARQAASSARGPARQADALRATAASRNAIPYRGTSQARDRNGRLVAEPVFNRAMARGQQAGMSQQCRTVNGRRVCGMTRQVAFRWSNGLAAAGGHQSQCPDGTMAMLALGHENIYRCVPF